jgi:predicted dehydrogenase
MNEVVIGQLGAGFIGKVHSLAYRNAGFGRRRIGASLKLSRLADIDGRLAQETAEQYGWARTTTDWRVLVDDPAINVFGNCATNDLHVDPCLAAAAAGKHVLCEKPLASDADGALRALQGVERAGVRHQCAFMYRFIPAVHLARELIRGGELGDVLHFRSTFLLSFALDPSVPVSWRFDRSVAGAGALGDLGSHHVDLARFLVAEVLRVASLTKTYVPEREGGQVTNDDSFVVVAELANGATASFEGSRVAGSHTLTSRVEIDGTHGSLGFDFERLNELRVRERSGHGFRSVLVTQPEHPYSDFWFPVGIQGQHPIGWADCFAHQAHCLLSAVASDSPLPEHAPTFRDGYRVAEVVDAIGAAAAERTWVDVAYRDGSPTPTA